MPWAQAGRMASGAGSHPRGERVGYPTIHIRRRPSARGRLKSIATIVGVLASLMATNVLLSAVVPAWAYIPAILVAAGLAVFVARRAGATLDDLGLAAHRARRSLLVGLGIGAVIVAIVLTVPGIRDVFADERFAYLGVGALAYQALVRIPLGTAVGEELLFRSVGLGVGLRRWSIAGGLRRALRSSASGMFSRHSILTPRIPRPREFRCRCSLLPRLRSPDSPGLVSRGFGSGPDTWLRRSWRTPRSTHRRWLPPLRSPPEVSEPLTSAGVRIDVQGSDRTGTPRTGGSSQVPCSRQEVVRYPTDDRRPFQIMSRWRIVPDISRSIWSNW